MSFDGILARNHLSMDDIAAAWTEVRDGDGHIAAVFREFSLALVGENHSRGIRDIRVILLAILADADPAVTG